MLMAKQWYNLTEKENTVYRTLATKFLWGILKVKTKDLGTTTYNFRDKVARFFAYLLGQFHLYSLLQQLL